MTLDIQGPLMLVGAGRMGCALLEGWLARGASAERITVVEPAPSAETRALIERYGVRHLHEGAAADTQTLVIAVKPQVMDGVLASLAPQVAPGTLVISIAAGRNIAGFERAFPGTAVVRAMPNTPAAIGRGITVCVGNARVGPAERATCTGLLGAVGEVEWIDNEGLMDAVTAVSGSGPAYIFLLAEALAAAGAAQGLEPELAVRLAKATVAGSGELLRQSGLPAATLRDNVTSPGGTTAAALSVLMKDDALAVLLRDAVAKATGRSRELAS